jgi:hypothetical protein
MARQNLTALAVYLREESFEVAFEKAYGAYSENEEMLCEELARDLEKLL